MANDKFEFNFHGPVGEHIDHVDQMTVNIGSDGTVKAIKQDNSAAVEIGRRLKVLRVERGMMAKDVCEKAGITNSTLTAIENGAYNSGIRQISNIAKALGAHVEIVAD